MRSGRSAVCGTGTGLSGAARSGIGHASFITAEKLLRDLLVNLLTHFLWGFLVCALIHPRMELLPYAGSPMNNFAKEEFDRILRRHSTGFSRGTSKYRGVVLHKCGRWEAHLGQFLGKK
ncbi:hypothetical protein MKW98_014127 [Papaver atlanticum]|uniref:Uncharacterized protein n=1 Tax=Papaver atlanticum TaxID=357466 RepID=A0AAD4SLN8_9MAGN|nr:hypothetical protein MKW98_014127 [Papaver atlanticum]